MNNNLNCEKDKDVLSYFIEKNHRVFYCNFDDLNNKESDLLNMKLILIKLNNGDLNYISEQLDRVIIKNIIKDCVIILEDPSWQTFIIYLKKKYAFKVIFNYSKEFTENSTKKPVLFKYNDRILDISDKIIISSPELYCSGTVKNDGVDIINTICDPEHIENVIKEIHGLVSIIIVTFNNLSFTKQCINSILNKTAYPNYEIIIVDNNSYDETQMYLTKLQKFYDNIIVISNEKNIGFAKANNIGIRHAKGDYIILLNNDTMITKGWITGFVRHLDRNDKLGLIGPVTNASPNESKIDVSYTTMEEMDTFAEEYTNLNFNKLYWNLRMLLMFCVAMKREIIDEVGYLDENFGIGMFEDDDYSHRVKLKGYRIACAEDVFIHHYGGASFNKIEYNEYWKLFFRNKSMYEKKWHTVWQGHQHRL